MANSLERWIGDQITARRGGEWVSRSVADEYLQRAREDGPRPARKWLGREIGRLTQKAVGNSQLTGETK